MLTSSIKKTPKGDLLCISFAKEFVATGATPFPVEEIQDHIERNRQDVQKVLLLLDMLKPYSVNVVNGLVILKNCCEEKNLEFRIAWQKPNSFFAKKLKLLLAICKHQDLYQKFVV